MDDQNFDHCSAKRFNRQRASGPSLPADPLALTRSFPRKLRLGLTGSTRTLANARPYSTSSTGSAVRQPESYKISSCTSMNGR